DRLSFVRDADGRIARATHADQQAQYTYDEAGNLVGVVNTASDTRHHMAYADDAIGRLVAVIDTDGLTNERNTYALDGTLASTHAVAEFLGATHLWNGALVDLFVDDQMTTSLSLVVGHDELLTASSERLTIGVHVQGPAAVPGIVLDGAASSWTQVRGNDTV